MNSMLRALAYIILISVLVLPVPASGQSAGRDEQAYREKSAALREAIWGLDLPFFKERNIPEHYRNKSRVVLARYTDLSAGSKRGLRRGNTSFTMSTRELVLLNDAKAVREASELSYTQMYKRKAFASNNQASFFVGIRVMKPSGKVIEISGDDVVLTEDDLVTREAKIAIPDLQPGDMLDYYVAGELDVAIESITTNTLEFPFYDDEPVQHYGIHCSIGKKFAAEYRCFNGAPDFKSTVDEDGNNQLDLTVDSLLYVPAGTPWTSPMRQFPLIQLTVIRGDLPPYTAFTRRRPGALFKNQDPAVIVKDEMIQMNQVKQTIMRICEATVGKKSAAVAQYYDALLKGGNTLHEDSAAAELYYMFRFEMLFNRYGNPDKLWLLGIARNPSVFAYLLSEYFKHHGLHAEVVLSTASSGPRMSELLDREDLQYVCNVHKTHDLFFGISNVFSPAFYVPVELEGASDAIAVDTKGLNSYMANQYTQRVVSLPRSGPEENVHQENLTILPDPGNNGVRIARVTSLSGHYKEEVQSKLLLMEDFYNYERAFYNETRSLTDRISNSNPDTKKGEELEAKIALARKEQQDAFLTEAKDWLEEEVTDIANAAVINPGVRHSSPAFEYASAFRLNSVLKRGGNNYLLEVGKLIGNPMQISEAHRERSIDVYLPFANTVRITMSIRIPDGYEVDGAEALAKSVSNETGHFTATAGVEGSFVILTVEKVFNKAFYPAKEWSSIQTITDAAAAWKGSKLLFRKRA